MMPGVSAVEMIAAFAAAWNTADDAERLALLAGCCLPDAVFAAPQGKVTGIDAMSASIGEFRRAFPAADVSFGVPDGYGQFARVSWVTRWNDGRADLAGEDFAHFGADGRIHLLVSFNGTPALPAA
jgi:SnoaL-like domain